MTTFIRHKVSKNKRRFQEDGFDLDLTYITERIIAMGFPSSKREAYFRNPLPEVLKFFEKRHSGHYKLYNLCAERVYDITKFHSRVSQFPFFDHNAPPIKLIQECLHDVEDWLNRHPNNMVGINCKAGKGRTGLIICCYLLHSGQCNTTDEALKLYGEKRTKDGKGVTIASQIRYIRYYERLLKELDSVIPEAPKVILSKIVINSPPKLAGFPMVWIEINNIVTHRSKEYEFKKKQKEIEFPVEGMCEGDCKIQLVHKQGKKLTKVCHFWFNTGFIQGDSLLLEKSVIDVANKDKKSKIFKSDFTLTTHFRIWDAKTDKDEEKYNNWKSKSIASQKLIQKAEKEEMDEGADTESSFELKAEEDDQEEKKKKKSGDEKKEKKLKKEKVEKKTEKEKEEDKDEKNDNNINNAVPDDKDPENGEKEDEQEEEAARKKSPSFYKYEGYNLDIKLTESEEESVDISEDPTEHSSENKTPISISTSVSLVTSPVVEKKKGPVVTVTTTSSTGGMGLAGSTTLKDSKKSEFSEKAAMRASKKEKV